jgi:hypothetical protein
MENNTVRQIYCSKFIYLNIHNVRAHLYCKRISLVCDGLYCTENFWWIWPKMFNRVGYCESCKNRIRGQEGGLLQLAVGTGGLLLLVQQAR